MTTPIDHAQPRPRVGRLHDLLAVMRCPATGQDLAQIGDRIETADHTVSYALLDGRPVVFPGLNAMRFPDEHLSNSLSPIAREVIGSTNGLVLNLSAGGSEQWFENVIEAEAAVFRNTDIVTDAHALPFKDQVFDGVVAMNAFEHYHSPHVVAAELMRILKPGGRVAIHTAFMQPLHEPPYHFYNCTEFGLRQWFNAFQIDDVSVTPNFNPGYTLAWLCFELEQHYGASGDAVALDMLRKMTIQDLSRFWWDRSSQSGEAFSLFTRLPQDVQKRFSAGFQLVARKPA